MNSGALPVSSQSISSSDRVHKAESGSKMSLTIEHIASLADVSRSTVSRVLNNHPASARPSRARPAGHPRTELRPQGRRPQPGQLAHRHHRPARPAQRRLPGRPVHRAHDPVDLRGQRAPGLLRHAGHGHRRYGARLLRPHPAQPPLRGVIMFSSDIDDPILPLLIKDGGPMVLIGRHPVLPERRLGRRRKSRRRARGGGAPDRARPSPHRPDQRPIADGGCAGPPRRLQAGAAGGRHRDRAELMVEGFYSEWRGVPGDVETARFARATNGRLCRQ